MLGFLHNCINILGVAFNKEGFSLKVINPKKKRGRSWNSTGGGY